MSTLSAAPRQPVYSTSSPKLTVCSAELSARRNQKYPGDRDVSQQRNTRSKQPSITSPCSLPAPSPPRHSGEITTSRRESGKFASPSECLRLLRRWFVEGPKHDAQHKEASVLPGLPTPTHTGYILVSLPGCCGCCSDSQRLPTGTEIQQSSLEPVKFLLSELLSGKC